MTDKITTPVGKVTFYALDRPAQNGKFSLSILIDLKAEGVEEFKKAIGKNKSVNEVVVDGKPFLKVGASTKFDTVKVADAEGNEIAAPDNVRVNLGDVMKARILVSAYDFHHVPTGNKGSALNLHAAKILLHDTTNREEVADTGAKTDFLDALNAADNSKLDKLKG